MDDLFHITCDDIEIFRGRSISVMGLCEILRKLEIDTLDAVELCGILRGLGLDTIAIMEELEMSAYVPSIGDVIKNNDCNVVVVAIDNHEDIDSCDYDKEYLLVAEEYLRENQGVMTYEDMLDHGDWVKVTGMSFPIIEKVNCAPYDIQLMEVLRLDRKLQKLLLFLNKGFML